MRAFEVVLSVYAFLTPEQREDVALFQKLFVNKDSEEDKKYHFSGNKSGGSYKDENNWLIYDDVCLVGIGMWKKGWPKHDWADKLNELSPEYWDGLREFHSKIVLIRKAPEAPFELLLRSGLTIVVAPRVP